MLAFIYIIASCSSKSKTAKFSCKLSFNVTHSSKTAATGFAGSLFEHAWHLSGHQLAVQSTNNLTLFVVIEQTKLGPWHFITTWSWTTNCHTIKTNCIKLYRYRDMLNFDFLEKGLGLVSPPHFVYDFSRNIFFMLQSTYWPDFILSLPLLLEIFSNMCIEIVSQTMMSWIIKLTLSIVSAWVLMLLANHKPAVIMLPQSLKDITRPPSIQKAPIIPTCRKCLTITFMLNSEQPTKMSY